MGSTVTVIVSSSENRFVIENRSEFRFPCAIMLRHRNLQDHRLPLSREEALLRKMEVNILAVLWLLVLIVFLSGDAEIHYLRFKEAIWQSAYYLRHELSFSSMLGWP